MRQRWYFMTDYMGFGKGAGALRLNRAELAVLAGEAPR
jgi:hypothetical protein